MTSQVNFGDGGLMVPTYPDTTALKTYAHTLNYAMHTVIPRINNSGGRVSNSL